MLSLIGHRTADMMGEQVASRVYSRSRSHTRRRKESKNGGRSVYKNERKLSAIGCVIQALDSRNPSIIILHQTALQGSLPPMRGTPKSNLKPLAAAVYFMWLAKRRRRRRRCNMEFFSTFNLRNAGGRTMTRMAGKWFQFVIERRVVTVQLFPLYPDSCGISPFEILSGNFLSLSRVLIRSDSPVGYSVDHYLRYLHKASLHFQI